MTLKVYDTKEAVPEAVRANAIETADHKFVVDEVDPNAISAAAQSTIDRERELRKTEEKARKKADDDLAELRRTSKAKEKGLSEEDLAAIRNDVATTYKPVEEERDRLAAENLKLKLTDKVQALALQHGIMADRIEDAMVAVLEKRTALGDAGGVVFKDKEGKVTADDARTFFTKLKAERPWYFAGSGAAGSGARGSDGGGDETQPAAAEDTIQRKRQQVAGSL